MAGDVFWGSLTWWTWWVFSLDTQTFTSLRLLRCHALWWYALHSLWLKKYPKLHLQVFRSWEDVIGETQNEPCRTWPRSSICEFLSPSVISKLGMTKFQFWRCLTGLDSSCPWTLGTPCVDYNNPMKNDALKFGHGTVTRPFIRITCALLLHGDEGRSLKKSPILCVSTHSILGYGLSTSKTSQNLNYDEPQLRATNLDNTFSSGCVATPNLCWWWWGYYRYISGFDDGACRWS